MEACVKVLGGLPITVEFEVYEAEPDVGLMFDYHDDWHISEVAGRRVKKAEWVYKRLSAEDEDLITSAIVKKINREHSLNLHRIVEND